MNVGPDLKQDNLLYGYDTGYGVSNIGTTTYKFFKGQPGINLTTGTLTPVFSNWGGLTGGSTTYTNGHNGNSGVYLYIIGGGGVNWWTSPSLTGISASTVYTVSATIKFNGRNHTGNDANIFYVRQYRANNSQITEGGHFHADRKIHLGDGWYRAWGTFTTTSETNRILLHGYTYDSNTEIFLQDLQFELGGTPTPFAGYGATRSDTQSLIDLKETTSINVQNLSFDNLGNGIGLVGNPTFDGTNDFIDIPTNFGTVSQYSFEWVENPGATHKMPIANRTNTQFYKYGAYSWYYTHGGTAGEFYHTTGVTSGWHHWAITYDGATLKIFQDNISLGTRAVTGTADFSNGFKVGWWSAGGAYAFNGDIPVMKIYDRALTTSEVASNFKAYKNRFNI